MRRRSFLPLLFTPVLAACTQTAPPSDTTPADDSKNKLSITTDTFDVPAGDYFECFYTGVVTQEELSVSNAVGVQAQGGHHIIVYYTDSTDNSGHHECNEAEMTAWHQVVGVSGKDNGEPVIALPEGVAFKVPAGKQIVLQSHYINTTGDTMKGVKDEVTMNLMDPSKVEGYANLWTLVDLQFDIPANGKATSVSTGTLKQDVPFIYFLGHMHEFGSHFKFEIMDDSGNPTTFYEKDWAASYSSHPPMLQFTKDKPYVLKKGTKVRQTCTWDNNTPNEMKFPREMCVGVGYYYPDTGAGEVDEIAVHQPSQ